MKMKDYFFAIEFGILQFSQLITELQSSWGIKKVVCFSSWWFSLENIIKKTN